MLPPDLLSLSTMTLATTGADGAAHAAAVYFAADEYLRFYFFSAPDSQHSQDIQGNPKVAVALYPECNDWQDIRGLQMHGEARRMAEGAAWQAAWQCYAHKFPFVVDLEEVIARNALYAFQPRWIRLVDNRRGFGFKQEWTLP
ncbi:MAG: hypothetical protein A2W36_05815 [Chloroflexi bacterium RBG_16_58_14]|nr:MAG: hypothetical protein A2W36_05815 [Chloroflexi bacterium RBG_16_58_14]